MLCSCQGAASSEGKRKQFCSFSSPQVNSSPFPVAMTRGSHLFPSRTQKLSLSVPNVLGWTRPGSIGRRRIPYRREPMGSLLFLFTERALILCWLQTIALAKAEVSCLRARPKGFPVALWKPSGPFPCCFAFNVAQYTGSTVSLVILFLF